MGHNLYHSVPINREMYMKCVVETILTSFLLLTRVWARPFDVVCDGGRGEGDKWFDGCRWCVCQQSGPKCSSSECSPLVSRVLPCQKVESRWYDGCYHCKCYHHGIECTANESCIMLMRTERFHTDFLSRGACVNPIDDRCVCGIDGVPSCSAEVIDRNAVPATTIGLNPVLPASSGLVVPKVVYYQRPYRSYEKPNRKIPRTGFYSDSSYIDDENDRRIKRTAKQIVLRHSLVKRQSYRRHSRESAEENNHPQVSKTRNKMDGLKTPYTRDSSIDKFKDKLRHKIKRRDCSHGYSFICSYDIPQEDVWEDNGKKWPRDAAREIARKNHLDGVYGSREFRESSKVQGGEMLADENVIDGPGGGNQINNDSPSLLIASDNRCRWGVRWYGGSLRCYCDVDNSITCGDPSFVASRIDGFRLESASCEEGHVWEDQDSCRECECQINGVVLCRRSSSCPLPFLIKPFPMYPDDDDDDRKELILVQKGSDTDEFTGQTEQKIDWDTTKQGTNPQSGENISNENNDNNILVNKNSGNKYSTEGTFTQNIISSFTDSGESNENLLTRAESNFHTTDVKTSRDFLNHVVDPTSPSNSIIDLGKDPDYDSTDGGEENDDSKVESMTTIIDSNNNSDETKTGDVEWNDFKRTTQVILGDCKPKSRWLDGCKRCECDQEGKKLCNDSRCLKPMSITMEITNVSSDVSDNQHTRPVQRPPLELYEYFSRNSPVNLSPSFLSTESCGRFTVGQKYWEDCNMCVCTPQGPKCTAKNCT